MKIWTLISNEGVSYTIPSEANTYEEGRSDFSHFLGMTLETFVEFEKIIDRNKCKSSFKEDIIEVIVEVPLDEIPSLEDIKKLRFQTIDLRTNQLIKEGFSFNGKRFSLSLNAQIKIIGAYTKKSEAFIYPLVWNTIDDLEPISIINESDFDDFFNFAFGTVKLHLDSGTNLKNQIRLASTIDETESIIDNRK